MKKYAEPLIYIEQKSMDFYLIMNYVQSGEEVFPQRKVFNRQRYTLQVRTKKKRKSKSSKETQSDK